MVVGFTITCAISAYHNYRCEFESAHDVPDTTLCDKICQWIATGQWFSPGTLVSSTNKTEIVESGIKQHETNAYALVDCQKIFIRVIFLWIDLKWLYWKDSFF